MHNRFAWQLVLRGFFLHNSGTIESAFAVKSTESAFVMEIFWRDWRTALGAKSFTEYKNPLLDVSHSDIGIDVSETRSEAVWMEPGVGECRPPRREPYNVSAESQPWSEVAIKCVKKSWLDTNFQPSSGKYRDLTRHTCRLPTSNTRENFISIVSWQHQ